MKRCGACNLVLDESSFSSLKSSKDGLAWRCRDCDRVARLKYVAGISPPQIAFKMCPDCEESKSASEFYRNKSTKDGLSYACKLCACARTQAHKARLSPDERSAKSREYYRANRLDILARAQAARSDRRAVSSAVTRRWKLANPARVTASEEKRRARKRAAGSPGVTPEEWSEILEQFGHRCAYCMAAGKLSMDHFRPFARCGAHSPDNVVPACRACNSSKGDDLIFDWLPRFERAGRLARHAADDRKVTA